MSVSWSNAAIGLVVLIIGLPLTLVAVDAAMDGGDSDMEAYQVTEAIVTALTEPLPVLILLGVGIAVIAIMLWTVNTLSNAKGTVGRRM